METRFIQGGPVLDERGRPIPGWGPAGQLQYRRKSIRAPFYRIKEWDWYQVNDKHRALQFTYGHASYAGQVGVSMFDFSTGEKLFNKDIILPLPFSSLHLEENADEDGVLEYSKKDMLLRIERKAGSHTIACRCEGFEAEVVMEPQNPNAIVINIPFDESPTAFYYNHKINCMKAKGRAVVNGREYLFGKDAWGLLDWGRGVWPFHNEWYWSNATGMLDGEIFGFNLGCGFGNTSAATENALFYKGALHKLGAVDIIPGKPYMDPWRLVDKEGRLDLTLTPVYDRTTVTKLLWVDNCVHQMFGEFAGRAVLDDGTELKILGITGFAEHAVNNW